MENKKDFRSEKDLLNDLKQFIHKNKKQNLALEKIINKINQSLKSEKNR